MTGVSAHPDFPESLRLLSQYEQYSDTDIGLMFGISRERIRQLRGRYGMLVVKSGGLNSMRIWDDDARAFRPVARSVLREQQRRQRAAERAKRRAEQLARRRAHVVGTIHSLRATLGRTPSLAEIADALRLHNVPAILHYWGGGSRAGVLAAIWTAAGMRPRATRGPGHVKPREKPSHCGRGHPFSAENTYTGPKGDYRHCRQCRALRRAAVRKQAVAT